MIIIGWDDDSALTGSQRDLIKEICSSTEPEIREHLPTLARDVHLSIRTGRDVIPDTGEVGGALSPGHVYWMVDHSKSVEETVIARLRPTLFHEFHHLVRGWVMSGGDLPKTFMHGVVSEGLATAFERDAAGAAPPWGEYPDEVRIWVDELIALPKTANYSDWMFMHPDGRRWIGYRAGTFIADKAIQVSGRTAAELVNTPSEEVLKLAML